MPDFEKWNKPDVVKINNCYNYATDDLHKPEAGKALPLVAEPGRTKDISAGKPVDLVPDEVNGGATVMFDFTCKGVKTAALDDGLKETDATGKCAATCWRVAYFIRPFKAGSSISGTYHFVREDSEGKWSHKPGSYPATDKQYDPASQTYGGKPITNPETDNCGPELKFCGYLCCCAGQKVAMVAPKRAGSGATLAHAGRPDALNAAMVEAGPGALAAARLVAKASAALPGAWRKGFGPGLLLYRLDHWLSSRRIETVFMTTESVTIWDGTARHKRDPGGTVAALVATRGARRTGAEPRARRPAARG